MINSVGQALSAALEAAKLRETGQARATAAPATETPEVEEAAANPGARMAAQGAPIDVERVARIKQAIASGQYPVDPDKIAEKMLDLDLPVARH